MLSLMNPLQKFGNTTTLLFSDENNCSTWRLKIRKTHTPFSQDLKNKYENSDKDAQLKTFILSKQVAIRGQEVNIDFMKDLEEADNCTFIDSPIQLDTGYDK